MNPNETEDRYLSEKLVSNLGHIRRESLPEEVIEKTKACWLDFLAACFSAADSKAERTAFWVARKMGFGTAPFIGRSYTGNGLASAFYNGILAHIQELDDSHRYVSGLHLGAVVFPAVLALAKEVKFTGEEFIRAVACGYQGAALVCRCLDQGHRRRGFHSTGTIGPFGSCIGAGTVLGLNGKLLVEAIGIVGSAGAGLFAFLEEGATVKHFHTGRAALDGLLAALLAKGGMTGPKAVFEAKEGFFKAYADEFDDGPLKNPPSDYEILNVYHKIHSACGHSFPAIDAALDLKEEIKNPDTIESVEIKTYRAASVLTNSQPQSVQEARFSIPFLVGLALVKGQVGKKDITGERLKDRRVMEIAARVKVMEDFELQESFPRMRAGILQVTLKDGKEIIKRVDSPRGMPENPISLSEIVEKFNSEAAHMDPKVRRLIIEKSMKMEKLVSITELTGLL